MGAPERIWLNTAGDYDEAYEAMLGTDTGVTWCDMSQDEGDDEYIRADIAAAQVAAAYERAAGTADVKSRHGRPVSGPHHAGLREGRKQASKLIRALATDTQTDALELVRKEAALKALADMGQEWDADTAAAQVAAAYERAADWCRDHTMGAVTNQRDAEYCGVYVSDEQTHKPLGKHQGMAYAEAIRALATDTQTDALEQVRRDAERAGYERGVRESLQTAMSDKAMRDAAFDAMWKVATETYSLEATNENGARYSITGDVVNALWYASMQSMIALLDKPTPDPDEQTKAQDLAFKKAVSS